VFFLETKVYCLIIAVAVIKVEVFYIPQILLFEEMGNFWIVPLSQLSRKIVICLCIIVYTSHSRFCPTFCLVINPLVNCPFNGEDIFHIRMFNVRTAEPGGVSLSKNRR
jgi:hypothetical protein